MKNIILISTAVLSLTVAWGQDDSNNPILTSIDSKYLFYIDFSEKSGTVFHLGRWIDKAGSGYSIIFTDTIIKQADNSCFHYSGKKTSLQKEQGKIYLTFNDGIHHQDKRVEIDTAANRNTAFNNINNAYWWTNFLRLSHDINERFPLYHYSFRNGFGLWKSFDNKETHYDNFKAFANKEIQGIRDNVYSFQTLNTSITQRIIDSISTIEYTHLKDGIQKLPTESYNYKKYYLYAVVNAICISRPELFFKLADDLPNFKSEIFGSVYHDKKAIENLKAVKTDSPSKKEFFDKRRKDRASNIFAVIFYTAGMIAFWGGITYLIVK